MHHLWRGYWLSLSGRNCAWPWFVSWAGGKGAVVISLVHFLGCLIKLQVVADSKLFSELWKTACNLLQSCGPLSDAHMHTIDKCFPFQEVLQALQVTQLKKNWRSWNFLAPCNLLLNKIQVPFSLQFHLLTYSYVCVLDASMSERSVKAKSFRTKVTAWYTGFLVWLIPYFSSHTTWDLYQILNFNKIILSFPCGVVFDGCTDGVWFHSSVSICGALQIQLVAA